MDKLQTSQYTNHITRLHRIVIRLGQDKEKHRRFKVGSGVGECDMFDAIMLDRIICKDLCYYNQEFDDSINDYLIKKDKTI